MTELWVEDLSAALGAASKMTTTSNHVDRYVSRQLGRRSLPEMPGAVRGEVQAAVRSAERLATEGCRVLDALAADVRATAARLQGLQTPPWPVNLEAMTKGYSALEPAIYRAHQSILTEWKANIDRQRALHREHSNHGTRRMPNRKENKAMLAYLKEREQSLARWGPRLRTLGRAVGVASVVADFASIYTDRTLLTSRSGRAAAGGTYTAMNLAIAARRFGAPVLIVDGVAADVLPDHYAPVSVSKANTSSAQGVGASYEALFKGDRTGVEAWHLRNRSGQNGVWAGTGAYLADLVREDSVTHHQQSLAGQHGATAENLAVTGETVHDLTTNPWKSVKVAGSFYWDAVT